MFNKCFITTSLFVLLVANILFAAPGPYWATELEQALYTRDAFLQTEGISPDYSSSNKWVRISTRESNLNSSSIWGSFSRGILQKNNSSKRDEYFSKALSLSENDPGALWLLCAEFLKLDYLTWAERCLEKLQKLKISEGAISVPLISKQLLFMGREFESSDNKSALFCYNWAADFDPYQPWSHFRSAGIYFPRNINNSISSFFSAIGVLFNSWKAQHSFLFNLYLWFRSTLLIFLFSTLLILSIKHVTKAVHPLNERLFSTIPLPYRTPLSIIVLLSLTSLGFIAFFWIIALFIFRFLKRNEKIILFASCTILALSPLDNWIQLVFLKSALPHNTPAVFSRISSEGYCDQLHTKATKLVNQNPDDYLAHLALSVSNMKAGKMNKASYSLDIAERIKGDDPITLLTRGNFHYLNGRIDLAETYFSQSLEMSPGIQEAHFNKVQCHLKRETISGTELLNELSKGNSKKINTFIETNDRHFGGNWPEIRKIMQPQITPFYFWSNFYKYGISPSFSALLSYHNILIFTLSFLLLALLFFTNWFHWSTNKVKDTFCCNLCGRITCRKCRKGTMCKSCFKKLKHIKNVSSIAYIKNSIIKKRKIKDIIVANSVAAILPGADKALASKTQNFSWLRILLSCSVIAAIYTFLTLSLKYPYNLQNVVYLPVFLLCFYIIYNIIKRIKVILNTLFSEKA
ncbi:hypothetical protein QA601_10045 [Chitinispirillales bacterium ANBcel5]|uniref:hypothetical protein n=1 Tax=Cellulosispirillum alkaliphilum TaxID=3039283 RepID=UPI002A5615F1|nr:hypothetical protein [Chitinispirillales bacterium ANBcel5]